MIAYRHYNIIVPKFRIEEIFPGGISAIHKAYGGGDLQEDEYLVAIGVENATEVRLVFDHLIQLGLQFDDKRDTTDHFAVVAKEGIWWDVPWLVCTQEGCWFIADVEAPVV